jgi:hypothetical protein
MGDVSLAIVIKVEDSKADTIFFFFFLGGGRGVGRPNLILDIKTDKKVEN